MKNNINRIKLKKLIENNVKSFIDQQEEILSFPYDENLNLNQREMFVDFITRYPIFRTIIAGKHINERLEKRNVKKEYFLRSLKSAIFTIDNRIRKYGNELLKDGNITYAIYVWNHDDKEKEDKIPLFIYPLDVYINSDINTYKIKEGYFKNIEEKIENDNIEMVNKLVEDKLVNGEDRITVFKYNTYYIPTVLSSDMIIKDKDYILDRHLKINEQKTYFLEQYVDYIIKNKEEYKNPLYENTIREKEKGIFEIQIGDLMITDIDYFSDDDYYIFPRIINFNKIKVLNVTI